MQKEEYLIKNACYSVTKYYLCKQNNKRSLLGRKQRSQVARSFPNRYLFSFTNKVTSLFSISCILRIILMSKTCAFTTYNHRSYKVQIHIRSRQTFAYTNSLHIYDCFFLNSRIVNVQYGCPFCFENVCFMVLAACFCIRLRAMSGVLIVRTLSCLII